MDYITATDLATIWRIPLAEVYRRANSALRAGDAVCDQCVGLGWVRIKGYVYGAACGYITATECMACNPDGRIAYTGQIDFINADRPLTEVP